MADLREKVALALEKSGGAQALEHEALVNYPVLAQAAIDTVFIELMSDEVVKHIAGDLYHYLEDCEEETIRYIAIDLLTVAIAKVKGE